MPQIFQYVTAIMIAGAFLLKTAPADAGPVRAARNVLMASRAARVMAGDAGDEAAAGTDAKLKSLQRGKKDAADFKKTGGKR